MTDTRKLTVVWELTRACDAGCTNCPKRAVAESGVALTTYESYKTIDQIASVGPAEFLISGGDPLEREDVYQLIDYARRRGLAPQLVVSPTTRLTMETVSKLHYNGLQKIVVSIDGSSPERHDPVHGAIGSFGLTLHAMRWAQFNGLHMDVNTLVCRRSLTDLPAIAEMLRHFSIDAWNLYFIVPVAGTSTEDMITAEETEDVFAFMHELSQRVNFKVRAVEAPHYTRFRLQQRDARRDTSDWSDFSGYVTDVPADEVVGGPDRFVFITHSGEVRPSEFLPLGGGNLRFRSLGTILRGSDLFVALRDSSNLKGKCGRCEFHSVCGGSRARAYAMTGDVFAAEPLCSYEPGTCSPKLPISRQKGDSI
jgi:radical SAM protein with 4Fe4S-binding SPASM domain